jgi:hypothetical protein
MENANNLQIFSTRCTTSCTSMEHFMEITLTIIILHLIIYSPYYLPALEKKLAQYLDKQTKPVQVDTVALEPSRGVPYWDNGRLICYMEI